MHKHTIGIEMGSQRLALALKRNRRIALLLLFLVISILVAISKRKLETSLTDTSVYPTKVLTLAFDTCESSSADLRAELVKESTAYMKDSRYQTKIAEARGERDLDTRGKSCIKFLREKVLAKGQSVLDLGCAAGAALKEIRSVLADFGGYGNLVGVELVAGWVKEAQVIFNGTMRFYNSDVTDFSLLDEKFDVITLNDVIEHIQPERYGCLFKTLQRFSRIGTAVYLHVPSPETQLNEVGQYYENVLPHHVLIEGMAKSLFQLEYFGYDTDTDCGHAGQVEATNTRNVGAKCIVNNVPKYGHFLFRYTDIPDVFVLTRRLPGK